MGSRFFAGEHMFYFSYDRMLAVDVIVGCFSMIRREAFGEVGLLDENLFMYGDDVDWCRRARNAGWRVVFYPEARAIHDRGKTTASYPVHFAVAQQRSILHYWKKHHTIVGMLGIWTIMLVHHSLRYTIAGLSNFTRSRKEQAQTRRQVSSACIRQLLFGALPPVPKETAVS